MKLLKHKLDLKTSSTTVEKACEHRSRNHFEMGRFNYVRTLSAYIEANINRIYYLWLARAKKRLVNALVRQRCTHRESNENSFTLLQAPFIMIYRGRNPLIVIFTVHRDIKQADMLLFVNEL